MNKKKIMTVASMLLLTGCASKLSTKQKLIGTWESKYELSVFGEVTETYSFKEDGKCVRVLNAGNDMADNCTYEFNKEENEIRIVWDNKIDKESFSEYIEVDKNTIMIGEHKFIKKEEANEKK